MVSIPSVAVDPAAVLAAAGRLRAAGPAHAEQAEILARTWTGLGTVYDAPETPALVAALDPLAAAARTRQERLAVVAAELELFGQAAERVVRQLDDLRTMAANTAALPFTEAGIVAEADQAVAELEEAGRRCAAIIRGETEQYAAVPGPAGANGPASALSWLTLLAGDQLSPLGSGYLDTGLELAMLTHFTNGSGTEYVWSEADLAALRADPAVQRAGADLRAGVPGVGTPVVLEGGQPGFRVDIDFKQPVDGRTVNPFDGSVGRGRVYYDAGGSVVGISDSYDFTNAGNAVDIVNLDAGLFGSRAFHDRGGVIEQQPADREVPVQPDLLDAVDRLFRRNVLGEDPGPYDGPN